MLEFAFWMTALATIVWAVLMAFWMHAFDDAGEPWWAIYVPIYSLVCALRTVGLSAHYSWLIVGLTVGGLVFLHDAGYSTNESFKQGGSMIGMFMVIAGPAWIHFQLVRHRNA